RRRHTRFSRDWSSDVCSSDLTKGTVVFFICNHCPFVHHILEEIIRICNDYRVEGIGFIAISSNDALQYPEDSPENMNEFAFKNRFPFPYLYDETQEVAKSYDAT